MIGLRAKSENKNGLGCDLNPLHPLKLVPEAVLRPPLLPLHVPAVPWPAVHNPHLY